MHHVLAFIMTRSLQLLLSLATDTMHLFRLARGDEGLTGPVISVQEASSKMGAPSFHATLTQPVKA